MSRSSEESRTIDIDELVTQCDFQTLLALSKKTPPSSTTEEHLAIKDPTSTQTDNINSLLIHAASTGNLKQLQSLLLNPHIQINSTPPPLEATLPYISPA